MGCPGLKGFEFRIQKSLIRGWGSETLVLVSMYGYCIGEASLLVSRQALISVCLAGECDPAVYASGSSAVDLTGHRVRLPSLRVMQRDSNTCTCTKDEERKGRGC